jgi:peptidyl-prolyl cis-trans isomerase C
LWNPGNQGIEAMAEIAANVQVAIADRARLAARQAASHRGAWRRGLARAAREPFLHFIALGALLFAFNEYLQARANFSRITVTRDEVAGIISNYQLQYGITPVGKQLDSLIDQFVREEVFYHEALRLGLDRNDEIIRRRLVQKYQFLQQDLAIAHEPSEAELRSYFQTHEAAYRVPAKLTFTQVYFSPDTRGDDGARDAARRLRAQLAATGATRAAAEGDAFPGPTDYAALTQQDVARVFGSGNLSDEIFRLPVGAWSPPLRSGLGWHLIYVDARQPLRGAEFAEVAQAVRRDYADAQRSHHNAEAFAKLKRSFTIVRE